MAKENFKEHEMKNKMLGLTMVIALSMIAAGGLWAQELKFDGYLNSGVGVVSDDTDADAYFKAFGVDSESNGYRFRLNGSYTNEAKNAGIRFRIQSQRRADRGGLFSLPSAHGWVSFFESKLTLAGGIVLDGTWETADWYWADDQGEGLGLLLKAEPVKGLILGVGGYVISQQGGGSNNALLTNSSLPNFGDVKLKPEDVKYTFNAAYTMPDTFRLGASFRTRNRAAWAVAPASINNDPYNYTGKEETSQFIGEFRLLKVKGLTTVVVGVVDNLEDFSEKGNILFSETFGYKATDDLNLGFNMTQFLYSREDVETDPALLFNLWGSYAIGNVIPRLDMVYFLGGQSKTATSAQQWDRRGFTARGGMPGEGATPGVRGEDDDYFVFSIRPSVKINLDSRIFLEIGDMINFDSANFDGYRKDREAVSGKNPGDTNSRVTNAFYVDLKFSF
jgi:hypothetical protein